MDTISTRKYPRDLGVLATDKNVLLYTNLTGNHTNPFQVGISIDGLNFKKGSKFPSLTLPSGENVNTAFTESFRAIKANKSYVAFYKEHTPSGLKSAIATSKDGYSWSSLPQDLPFSETAMLVPDFTYNS